jgi:hypothetical protein
MTESLEVLQVVKTLSLRGDGRETILRHVTTYWSMAGEKLAEIDPLAGNDSVAAYNERVGRGPCNPATMNEETPAPLIRETAAGTLAHRIVRAVRDIKIDAPYKDYFDVVLPLIRINTRIAPK